MKLPIHSKHFILDLANKTVQCSDELMKEIYNIANNNSSEHCSCTRKYKNISFRIESFLEFASEDRIYLPGIKSNQQTNINGIKYIPQQKRRRIIFLIRILLNKIVKKQYIKQGNYKVKLI